MVPSILPKILYQTESKFLCIPKCFQDFQLKAAFVRGHGINAFQSCYFLKYFLLYYWKYVLEIDPLLDFLIYRTYGGPLSVSLNVSWNHVTEMNQYAFGDPNVFSYFMVPVIKLVSMNTFYFIIFTVLDNYQIIFLTQSKDCHSMNYERLYLPHRVKISRN